MHHQPDHDVLVLRCRLGHEQRKRREPNIVDHNLTMAEEPAVAIQEVHEQEGADAFVAIGEGVILDDKVEKMRRF